MFHDGRGIVAGGSCDVSVHACMNVDAVGMHWFNALHVLVFLSFSLF